MMDENKRLYGPDHEPDPDGRKQDPKRDLVSELEASTEASLGPAAQPPSAPMITGPRVGGDTRKLAVNVLAGGGVNVVKIGLQLLMLPLMAHLLGPAEFGVYALALPTVAFFMTLADGGLGASLASEPTQSREIWSTAFWLLLMVGVGLAGIGAGWGLILGHLSHEPRVANVMALLSVSFILLTASVLPVARLTRERRLVLISGADLAANILGAIVAVTLAMSGAGAISLAAQYVTAYFVRAVILNVAAFVRPSFVFRLSALKSHISTGSSLVCSRLADFSGRLVENLVFGRTFGSAALGTFTFANQVPRFVCEAASGPVWGALYAQALHEDDARIGPLHAKVVHILTLILAPVAFLTSAIAPGLVHLILGPAWNDAATILSILIPFYALGTVASLSGAILLAKGAGWALFRFSLLLVVARIAAVFAGQLFGPVGVAWGIGLGLVLYAAMMLRAPGRIGLSPLGPLLRGMVAPTLAGALAGIACYFVVAAAPSDVLRMTVGLLTGGTFYLLILFLIDGKRMREDFNGILRLARR